MKHLKRGTRLPIRGQKLLPAASPVLILPKMNGWCVSKVLHQNKTGFMLQPGQDSTASQRFHRKCSRDRIPDLPSLLQRFDNNNIRFNSYWKHWTLFFLILSLCIFARIWEFWKLPPGLIADESSIGVEAYSLYHFGVDRNGISYSVYFVSWDSGQNAS